MHRGIVIESRWKPRENAYTYTHTGVHALSRSRAVIHTVERRETRPNQRCPLEDRSISISGEPVDVHSVCL